jgi:hypothetical protein
MLIKTDVELGSVKKTEGRQFVRHPRSTERLKRSIFERIDRMIMAEVGGDWYPRKEEEV